MRYRFVFAGLITFAFLFFPFQGEATDFTSDNFKVRDPVTSGGGGFSTSSSFQLWSVFSQPAVGTSSSDAFQLRSGFLYFPEAESSPPSEPPPPPPSGGGGSGSVTTPIPLRPPALIPPLPPGVFPPIISPIITFITGELIPTPGCRRSDLNCDGAVDLKDLSILLTRPKLVTGRILSLLFSDWTRRLPVPVFVEKEKEDQIAPSGRPLELAEISSLIEPKTGIQAGEQPRVSIFRAIGNFINNLFDFFGRIGKAVLGWFGL